MQTINLIIFLLMEIIFLYFLSNVFNEKFKVKRLESELKFQKEINNQLIEHLNK